MVNFKPVHLKLYHRRVISFLNSINEPKLEYIMEVKTVNTSMDICTFLLRSRTCLSFTMTSHPSKRNTKLRHFRYVIYQSVACTGVRGQWLRVIVEVKLSLSDTVLFLLQYRHHFQLYHVFDLHELFFQVRLCRASSLYLYYKISLLFLQRLFWYTLWCRQYVKILSLQICCNYSFWNDDM